jgi:hypothetical protein
MTSEVRAGTAVLAAVVAAVILWLALGSSTERHDGLTRVAAARRAAQGKPARCIRRVQCRAAAGHWDCSVVLNDGEVLRSSTDPAGPAFASVVSC